MVFFKKNSWNKKLIVLGVILSFLLGYKNFVFAQLGMSCANNTACTDPGFTCDMTKHECVQTSSDPGPAQSENTPAGSGTTDSGSNNSQLHEMASGLNKLKVDNVQAFIGILIKGAMGVVGTIAFVMMVYGGVLWMTARGNAEQISKAESTIVWATLGIVLIFASYALVGFIFEIFR